ncbi:MAG: type II toxin-antitoxin system RatA family toxin [Gammaproteobacteria bacterium]|nr:type II toxin-antitoxin system RatA family toxin [Gammaproteobacteria bacterium]
MAELRRLDMRRTLPFPREDVFDLVADVERYPDYLPGWQAARILERDGTSLVVEQELGGFGIRQRFNTRAQLERPTLITIEGDQAPFRSLHQTWTFNALGERSTELRFQVEYALRGRLLSRLVDRLCQHVFRETMEAFAQRARTRLR